MFDFGFKITGQAAPKRCRLAGHAGEGYFLLGIFYVNKKCRRPSRDDRKRYGQLLIIDWKLLFKSHHRQLLDGMTIHVPVDNRHSFTLFQQANYFG